MHCDCRLTITEASSRRERLARNDDAGFVWADGPVIGAVGAGRPAPGRRRSPAESRNARRRWFGLTATCRCTGTKRKAGCCWRSPASTRSCSIRSRCRPAWARTRRSRSRAAGPRRRRPVRARRAEGAAGAAQLSLPRHQRRTLPSGAPSPIRSRRRCCGASRSKPPRANACWWTRPRSSCATRTASATRLRRDATGQLPPRREPAAPSTCRARRASRRTPRSKRR